MFDQDNEEEKEREDEHELEDESCVSTHEDSIEEDDD